jgi:hypothetical protein
MGVRNVWVKAFAAAPIFSLTMPHQILVTLDTEDICLPGARVAFGKCFVTFSFQELATAAGTWGIAGGIIKLHVAQMHKQTRVARLSAERDGCQEVAIVFERPWE